MFTTFPRIFEGQYGFSEKSIGLTYLGIGVGAFIGLFFCGVISDRILVYLKKRNGGDAKPEYRLPAMIIGGVLVPAGLFIYAWTAEEKVHWIAPIIGTGFLGGGMFVIFVSFCAFAVKYIQLIPSRCPASHILSTRIPCTLRLFQLPLPCCGLCSALYFLLLVIACTMR